MDFEEYISRFDAVMQKYVLPKEKWTLQDEVIYRPKDLFRFPYEEGKKLRFKAIKYAFTHHYKNNTFYNKLCKEKKIKPEDIKNPEDIQRIPLLPDRFFKEYPADGKSFAVWLGNIYTGDLPNVYISRRNPKAEDVIEDFNVAGLTITLSSGTSGRHTFIPRDADTMRRGCYAYAKAAITMMYPFWEYDMCMYKQTDPAGTNLWVGKAAAILSDVVKEHKVGTKIRITPKMVRLSMGGATNVIERIESRIIRVIARRHGRRMVEDFIKWLTEEEKKDRKVGMLVQPSFLDTVMNVLEERGLSFDFSERGSLLTGGGWKRREGRRISHENFRRRVKEFLGIPEERCIDAYAMVESNAAMIHCPEGHYLHIPYTFFYPMVLDENLEPKGFGEKGRFAFLEATASSYPGFIISGDEVTLLEHCPACNRPGPVLEPEVKRAKGEEIRGCAEEMRRLFSYDKS